MKTIIIILFSILVTSSCYTKKKAIEKFCKQDSIEVTIHDTITTETIHVDSVFSSVLDTIILTKDKLTIRYYKIHDSIYLSGTMEADTIFYTKTIQVPIYHEKPSKLRWWWLIIALIFGAFLGLLKK